MSKIPEMTNQLTTFALVHEQRKFLEHLLDIQNKKIWNNGGTFTIEEILSKGEYDGYQRNWLNILVKDYKIYKETGVVTEEYKCDW